MRICACASAAWVNFSAEQTSPAAKMRRLLVCRSVLTRHTGRSEGDAGPVEPQSFNVWPPARSDEDRVDGQFLLPAAVCIMDHLPVAAPVNLADRGAKEKLHAVTLHPCLDEPGRIGLLPRQESIGLLQYGDTAAQAGEGLCQLAADRAGADHSQPWRQFGERKDRFVGMAPHFFQAGDRWQGRTRAGADCGPGEAKAPAVDFPRHFTRDFTKDFNGLAVEKAGLAEEDVHAQLLKALGRIVRADLGA